MYRMDDSVKFNILELYSGIGGFHFAIKKLFEENNRLNENVQITGVDINTTANNIYRHNFDMKRTDYKSKLLERNIQSFSVKELDSLDLDLLTMSPPCQPFTRLGLKRDLNDKRCDSFHHLMMTIPKMQKKPKFIMLENVKGFETSEAHELLIKTLSDCGYKFFEFLLTPLQFGIPNTRLRYYLLAKYIPDSKLQIKNVSTIHDKIPSIDCDLFEQNVDNFCSSITTGSYGTIIKDYLENDVSEQNYLSDKILLRYHVSFDLVEPSSKTSNCFTKAYTHRIDGTGSILKSSSNVSIDEVYCQLDSHKKDCHKNLDNHFMISQLRSLGLRFFTPREIANLMCFPKEFEFPSNVNLKQQYRVLGNSVNVYVCYYLLKVLLGPM